VTFELRPEFEETVMGRSEKQNSPPKKVERKSINSTAKGQSSKFKKQRKSSNRNLDGEGGEFSYRMKRDMGQIKRNFHFTVVFGQI
jgi:hypothetical protein